MSGPSAYSSSQIQQYESYVSLPTRFHQSSNPPLDSVYLTALHVHQIAAIPYENLVLHYSTTHAVSLDPQVLFKKMITDARGRGGYCMENSILFYHILKGLGFKVYLAGVRNRPRVGGVPGGEYNGWVHILNIVTLPDGTKWHVDVGFGGDGATKPLALVSGHAVQNLGSQEIRFMHAPLPHATQTDQLHWIYQYRNSKDQDWNSFYAFPELEFFPQDFEVMNHYTSTCFKEANFQVRKVLIIKFLKGDGEDDGIVGKVMLVDSEVKRNDGGKTRVVQICEDEEERVRAVREHFGIRLTEEEVKGVRGRTVELKRR